MPIKDEESIDEIIEANRQGHKFIKVFLDRARIQQSVGAIQISGAIVLRSHKSGIGIGGMPNYKFTPYSGELNFNFSREDREFVAWLLDDNGPGYFSAVGYNRDLLASHMDDNFFVIKDREVLEDITKRNKFMKENPGKREVSKPLTSILSSDASSTDELQRQIDFLQQKLQVVSERENVSIQDLSTPDKVEELGPLGPTTSELIQNTKLAEDQQTAINELRQNSIDELAELEKEAVGNFQEPSNLEPPKRINGQLPAETEAEIQIRAAELNEDKTKSLEKELAEFKAKAAEDLKYKDLEIQNLKNKDELEMAEKKKAAEAKRKVAATAKQRVIAEEKRVARNKEIERKLALAKDLREKELATAKATKERGNVPANA